MSETLIRQRYRLLRLIGEGGVGKVWEAEDTQTGQSVAIKRIHPDLARQESELKRFEREANLLRELDHPNIVKVLAFFEEWRRYYLVMSYIIGGSLYDLIQREGPLSVAKARQIGRGICRALTQTHSLGILHRDIKPENILFDGEGNPVLTDFGFARHKNDDLSLTQVGVVVGSLSHVSPEECQGHQATESSDIWRLGVVIYEMLTGKAPFEREGLAATVTAILTEPLPPLTTYRSDLPAEMIELVDVMLQKDPDLRVSSARLVTWALKRIPD